MNLYWHRSINFGDMLAPYLLSKMAKVDINTINYVDHTDLQQKYIITGSILSVDHIQNAVVYGAGFVFSNNYFTGSDILIKGIRGPLSLQKVWQQYDQHGNKNIQISEDVIVGEPSLALPYFFKPETEIQYKLGIIPHIVDYHRALQMYEEDKDIFVIDLKQRSHETIEMCVHRVITDILRCKKTVSSSLHGLIVSIAYGKPSDWCEFSHGKLVGDRFKFYDFLSSVGSIIEGNEYLQPINITERKLPFDELYSTIRGFKNEKIDIQRVLTGLFD